MDFDGDFAHADFSGNLLVQASGCNKSEDFAFSCGQRVEAIAVRCEGLFVVAALAIFFDSVSDRVEPFLIAKRFGQEFRGAKPHGLD